MKDLEEAKHAAEKEVEKLRKQLQQLLEAKLVVGQHQPEPPAKPLINTECAALPYYNIVGRVVTHTVGGLGNADKLLGTRPISEGPLSIKVLKA